MRAVSGIQTVGGQYSMEFAGIIESPPDPPGLDKSQWLDVIASRVDLLPAEPRQGTNPFTREPMTIYPRPDYARLVVNGQEVGSFSWAENEENVLIVSGDIDVVRSCAVEIAASLGGTFKSSDE
jgi:hypothetical protein